MRRWVILGILMAAGCGGKAQRTSEPGQEETPRPAATKPRHDYQGWQEYAPSDARFRIHFPAAPQFKPPSPATGNMYVVGVTPRADDELEYLCHWKLRDQPFGSREADEAYLNAQQLGAVNSSGGKLLEEEAISADGFPGRRFIIETAHRGILHNRSFVAGKRIVTLQVWGKTAAAVKSSQAVKFFDSLTISP